MDTYRPAPGTPVRDLSTPCLLVDMDALEANYRRVARLYEATGPKMRQHAKNVKSPHLVRLQIEAGGTVGGVCAAKVSEAEALVEGGITDVLVTSQVVGRDKLRRLCALARHTEITLTVDDPRQVHSLSGEAVAQGVTVGVVIEVNTSMGRAGVRTAREAVEIARVASGLPGVVFRGVMSHQTLPGSPDRETRFREGTRFITDCVRVARAIEDAGMQVEVVSSGETWTYDVAPGVPGVTEIEGGTYALMGANYSYMEDFQVAARVLSTIISRPDERTAIGDVGVRAMAGPGGVLPVAEVEGVSVVAIGEWSIELHSDGPMPFGVGDQFLLMAGQQDMMVNRWDQFIGVRQGLVEAVWEITARGCVH